MLRVKNNNRQKGKVVSMHEMKPLQVGEIIENNKYTTDFVMRTADYDRIEIIDLSSPGTNKCWTIPQTIGKSITVRLLPPGEKIELEVYNKEY